MPYRVEFTPSGYHDLRRLPQHVRGRMEETVHDLGRNPRPSGVRKLEGRERTWRIRVGPFRIVYNIYDDRKLVIIIRVVRRSETTYRL